MTTVHDALGVNAHHAHTPPFVIFQSAFILSVHQLGIVESGAGQ